MNSTMTFYLARLANEAAMSVAYTSWTERYRKERMESALNSFSNSVMCALDMNGMTEDDLRMLGFVRRDFDEDTWNIPYYLKDAVKSDTLLVDKDGQTVIGLPEKADKVIKYGCLEYGVRAKRKE